ncbi:hypothetical protein PAXRUDRAFT_821799 [Paxillus rubicundulus Ve08.2h10]|uniref:Uncharacterized protein n=1 Tax=Paxillus rubicundulus Ve08.2h10 TaxID=930991 RepID=A0A0D0DXN1_9AGAM|nr:hypothetical protein PAXRUDRAFT_821799 [Paxillus rubicundulus Ve08.2h10]
MPSPRTCHLPAKRFELLPSLFHPFTCDSTSCRPIATPANPPRGRGLAPLMRTVNMNNYVATDNSYQL